MRRWLAATLAALFSTAALAQGFPERPVKIIVPLTPGGSPDTIARAISAGLQWPQPVVVENRPGGSQNIGADLVAKSAPDGHTWLLAPDNVFSVNPYLGKQPFEPLTDFIPVTLLARIQFLLVVHPSLPVNSVQDLVAYAKSHPGELNHGSSGNGSPQHLGAAMLQLMTGTKMNHVPYKGAGPALQDLLGGQIEVAFDPGVGLNAARSGKLRMVAVAGPVRHADFPDVPTLEEKGVRGVDGGPHFGFYAPAATPRELVRRVNREVLKAMQEPAVLERFKALAVNLARPMSPEEFGAYVKSEYARYEKLLPALSIPRQQ